MTDFKCEYCGKVKAIRFLLKDYIFKRRVKADKKTVYFCCYDCMRKAEKENPDKFCAKKKV